MIWKTITDVDTIHDLLDLIYNSIAASSSEISCYNILESRRIDL